MSTKPEENTVTPIVIDPRMFNAYYNHHDEISLVDLWLTLLKHKKVFFSVAITIILLAIAFILSTPKTYTYKTDISIGTQSQSQLIQSPEAIAANLDNAIIPMVLGLQHQKSPENKLNVTASIPKKTDSVLLTSKGTKQQRDAIVELHQQLISILAESHRKKIQSTLDSLNDELHSSEVLLATLETQSKIQNIQNEQVMLQMIDLQNSIRQTKRKFAQITDTHSALGTVPSIKPTNKKTKLILAVSLILAFFAGLFATFIAEFLVKVREKSQATN